MAAVKSRTTIISTTSATTMINNNDGEEEEEGSMMSEKAREKEGVRSDGEGCRGGEGDEDDDDVEMVEQEADNGGEKKGRTKWGPSFLVYASSSGSATTATAVATSSATASCSLMFPSSFAQRYLRGCTGDIKLQGLSGWVWPCPLERDDDSMLLVGLGWEEFS